MIIILLVTKIYRGWEVKAPVAEKVGGGTPAWPTVVIIGGGPIINRLNII